MVRIKQKFHTANNRHQHNHHHHQRNERRRTKQKAVFHHQQRNINYYNNGQRQFKSMAQRRNAARQIVQSFYSSKFPHCRWGVYWYLRRGWLSHDLENLIIAWESFEHDLLTTMAQNDARNGKISQTEGFKPWEIQLWIMDKIFRIHGVDDFTERDEYEYDRYILRMFPFAYHYFVSPSRSFHNTISNHAIITTHNATNNNINDRIEHKRYWDFVVMVKTRLHSLFIPYRLTYESILNETEMVVSGDKNDGIHHNSVQWYIDKQTSSCMPLRLRPELTSSVRHLPSLEVASQISEKVLSNLIWYEKPTRLSSGKQILGIGSNKNNKFADSIIKWMPKCPIGLQPIRYPYIADDGITYDFFAICKWFHTERHRNENYYTRSITANVPMKSHILQPNHKMIERAISRALYHNLQPNLEELERSVLRKKILGRNGLASVPKDIHIYP